MTYQQPPEPPSHEPPPEPSWGPEEPRPRLPSRPGTVETSFWLGIASVVVGFIALGISFLLVNDAELESLTRVAGQQGQQLTIEQARSIYRVSAIAVLLVFLVIAAFWVLLLFYMRNGRNWARIVIAILAAIWVIVTAPSLSSGSAAGMLLGAVQLLVIVGTVVFAFVRPSQDYFDAVAAARPR